MLGACDRRATPPDGTLSMVHQDQGERMDRAALLARFLDDEALLSEMVTRLLERLSPELDAMRAASAARDAAALHQLAHSLKGSLGLFGPSAAYDAVSRLESLSREGNVDAAVLELEALNASLGPMTAELRRLVPEASESR